MRLLILPFLFAYAVAVSAADCSIFLQSSAKIGKGAASSCKQSFSDLVRNHRAGRDIFLSSIEAVHLHESGGPCAAVCAVNMTQSLRVMSGQPPVCDPINMMRELYAALPFVKRGAVANDGIVEILNYLFRTYLPGQSFDLNLRQLDVNATFSGRSVEVTDKILAEDLSSKPDQMKLVSVLLFEPSGKHIGGHYFVLQNTVDGVLNAVDPNFPEKDVSFELKPADVTGDKNQALSSFQLIPRGFSEVFNRLSSEGKPFIVVDSVLTVSLR